MNTDIQAICPIDEFNYAVFANKVQSGRHTDLVEVLGSKSDLIVPINRKRIKTEIEE